MIKKYTFLFLLFFSYCVQASIQDALASVTPPLKRVDSFIPYKNFASYEDSKGRQFFEKDDYSHAANELFYAALARKEQIPCQSVAIADKKFLIQRLPGNDFFDYSKKFLQESNNAVHAQNKLRRTDFFYKTGESFWSEYRQALKELPGSFTKDEAMQLARLKALDLFLGASDKYLRNIFVLNDENNKEDPVYCAIDNALLFYYQREKSEFEPIALKTKEQYQVYKAFQKQLSDLLQKYPESKMHDLYAQAWDLLIKEDCFNGFKKEQIEFQRNIYVNNMWRQRMCLQPVINDLATILEQHKHLAVDMSLKKNSFLKAFYKQFSIAH